MLLVLLLRMTRQRLYNIKLATAANVSQRVSAFGYFLNEERRALSGINNMIYRNTLSILIKGSNNKYY